MTLRGQVRLDVAGIDAALVLVTLNRALAEAQRVAAGEPSNRAGTAADTTAGATAGTTAGTTEAPRRAPRRTQGAPPLARG